MRLRARADARPRPEESNALRSMHLRPPLSVTPTRRQILGTALALAAGRRVQAAEAPAPLRPYKIFHVMSFDSPWRWTDGQWQGFRESLGAAPHVGRVFQMDVKRHSSPEAKARQGAQARAQIDAWKPDLLYASDDDAQDHVTRHYAGTSMPCVFSGVNRDPTVHGLAGAANVTGVLEHEHVVETIRLLQALQPSIRRLAVISDDFPHWLPVIERVRAGVAQLPGVSLAAIDVVPTWDAFKARVLGYPRQADAVLYLGIFGLKGADGRNVPYQMVQQWCVENSRLPDGSFWIDRIHHGVLASSTISEREQGRAAGRLARAILVEGRQPSSLPVEPTRLGNPALNLARARQLGLPVRSGLLLSAEVVKDFEWERTAR